jgi:hypothetical protein
LIACPLVAQETEQVTKEQVKKWFEQLQHADQAKRTEAIEALGKLDEKALRLLLEVVREQAGKGFVKYDEFKTVFTPMTTLTLAPDSPGEIIKGSWAEKGEQIDYTLKSLGKGRYKLEAQVKGDAERTVKDEGTMDELKGRHKFLKAVVALVTPTPEWRLTTDLRQAGWAEWPSSRDLSVVYGPKKAAKPQSLRGLGVTVKPPSEELGYHLYLPQGVGLVIDKVKPGSKGEKLGLKRFDVLTKIGGEYVENSRQLQNPKGTLELVRRGKPLEIEIGG